MKWTREQMAARVARDIPEGAYVNLGIGLPTLVANHLSPGKDIFLHSENGLLGMGPAPLPGQEDPDLTNAGKQPVTLVTGGAFFNHADSFGMIRGGHILEYPIRADVAIIKAAKADRWGNLIYRKAARNFGPVMAMAAACTIAQVDEVVELGALDPEAIVTPGIFVHRVVTT